MITKTENADGTITIHADEDTVEMIWALAYTAAQDEDNTGRTREISAQIANATHTDHGTGDWRA